MKAAIVGDPVEDVYSDESNKAIVLTTGGALFNTFDGGQTWERIGVVQNNSPHIAMFKLGRIDNSHLWVLGGSHSLEGTTTTLGFFDPVKNGWQSINIPGWYLNDILVLSKNQILACGFIKNESRPTISKTNQEGVILYSNDGGHTWETIYRNPLISSVNALTLAASDRIWAVGNGGLVVSMQLTPNRSQQAN